jgi:hypothetical protein
VDDHQQVDSCELHQWPFDLLMVIHTSHQRREAARLERTGGQAFPS